MGVQEAFTADGVDGEKEAEDEEDDEIKVAIPDQEKDDGEGQVKAPAEEPPAGKADEGGLEVAGLKKSGPAEGKEKGVAKATRIGHEGGEEQEEPGGEPAGEFNSQRDGAASRVLIIRVRFFGHHKNLMFRPYSIGSRSQSSDKCCRERCQFNCTPHIDGPPCFHATHHGRPWQGILRRVALAVQGTPRS